MTPAALAARLLKLADWERDDPYGSGDHQWLRDAAAIIAASAADVATSGNSGADSVSVSVRERPSPSEDGGDEG